MSTLSLFLVALFGPGNLPALWAYLDPGSGSMLFQMLIAGLLSAFFCARSSYGYLKDLLFAKQPKT